MIPETHNLWSHFSRTYAYGEDQFGGRMCGGYGAVGWAAVRTYAYVVYTPTRGDVHIRGMIWGR